MDASARTVGPSVENEDPVQLIANAVGRLWWLWLVFGCFWLVVAFVVLQFDQASIKTVGVLFGFMFLAAALQQFVIAVFADGWARWVLVFFGLLLLAGAILSFIEPEETFAGVADILGFVFLIIGVFWTIQALAERGMNRMWWIGLISGIALDRPGLLDLGPVLHREGVHAPGVRRHLGALPRRHRSDSRVPDHGRRRRLSTRLRRADRARARPRRVRRRRRRQGGRRAPAGRGAGGERGDPSRAGRAGAAARRTPSAASTTRSTHGASTATPRAARRPRTSRSTRSTSSASTSC